MNQSLLPLVILIFDQFTLPDARLIDCGRFEGPGALQAPSIDGHFEDEVLFNRVSRLEFRYIRLMKCFPIVAGFAFEDDEFIGRKSMLDCVLR